MEKTITQLEGCFQKVDITLQKAELEPYYEKGYKEARKTVQMPGFRRGKVPMNMIKKFYGSSIEVDAEQDAINELFPKIAEEDNLTILGQPSLTNIDKTDDAVTFTIQYETIPEIQLKDYKSIVIDEPVHVVEDEEIEKELFRIRNENADFEPAQVVEDENYVVELTMTEIDKETKEPVEGLEPRDFPMYLNDDKNIPEIKEAVIGRKIKEEFEFSPPMAEEAENSKLFKVLVKDIQKLIQKELDSEFISKYTSDKFDNVDDLKEEIGFQLQEEWDTKSRQKMENDIIEKLVEMHDDISVPENIVEKVMQSMFEDFKKEYSNLPKDAFDFDSMKGAFKPRAEATVKFEMIRNKIVEDEGITVEEFDISPHIESYVKETNRSEDEIRDLLMNNQGFMNSLLHKKVMDFILDFAETREVDFDGNPLNESESEESEIDATDNDNTDNETSDNSDEAQVQESKE